MSRTPVFLNSTAITEALQPLQSGPLLREQSPTSYYLMRKLVAQGFVQYTEGEKKEGRGRRAKQFEITPKGINYLIKHN